MATDPVCGMSVDPKNAAGKYDYEGCTYQFCSKHCLTKFSEAPEKYVKQPHEDTAHLAGVAPHTVEQTHTAPHSPKTLKRHNQTSEHVCPMHPEVRESVPGACPKCGMALEPATVTAAPTRVEYVCPMHPEIVRDQPGSCPICGMALEPRTVTLEDAPNPELVDMTRRFWISAILSLPLFILAMAEMLPGQPLQHLVSP